MKRLYIFLFIGFLSTIFILGCNKKLVEDPQSILTPSFFGTSQGFQQGLDAAYAGTRLFWGNQTYFTLTVIGTDEFKRGIDGNSNINIYSSGYDAQNGDVLANWRNAYTFINTCNGLIDNADKLKDIPEATKNRMVAEAKFLRANYYFILVQFHGDITLNKNFQATPSTSAVRDPISEVYKFIIQDLKDAIAVLPAGPKTSGVLAGKANAAVARHVLAKVYLTRAGSSAKEATDYADAYTAAHDVINSRNSLGLSLLQDFGKVYEEGNERNAEVLWTSEHTSNLAFNGPNNSGVTNFSADNVLNHMWVGQYERKEVAVLRSTLYGRPYIRCTPTLWLTETAFAERVNDTRYNKTFQTVWYANSTNAADYPKWKAPLPPGAPPGAVVGQPRFKLGDTAIYMPGVNKTDAEIAASTYLLIPPRKYDATLGPTMFKYFDTKRANLNFPSIRPVIAYRLGETYLIAAEAAFMSGKFAEAVTLTNAIRERAAFPTGNPASMRIQASDLSIDFFLNERTRELCGELVRWLDLVRTGKLIERVKAFNPEAAGNIVPKHVLRPIPQAQIDAVVTGEPYPQNPGW